MALEIKITDSQIRPSLEFLDFLSRAIAGESFKGNWYDQISENLKSGNLDNIVNHVKSIEGKPITDPRIQQAIIKSYELTIAILIGDITKLEEVQNKYEFIFVVGCPRSGGSYLTKQLFMALGMDPAKVPGLLAHDGYPKAWPFYLENGHNSHTDMARYTAEYIVLSMLFFEAKTKHANKFIIPKKNLNAAYHGAFFQKVFGSNTEFLWTVRHPLTSCISTYEKSGGYPKNGKFTVRGNIESFIQRDLAFTGADGHELIQLEYFDVYLRYWEQYHYNLALTGMPQKGRVTIIPYTREHMMVASRPYFSRFGSDSGPEEFLVFDKRDRHKDWTKKADLAINRVYTFWKSLGLEFPIEEIQEAW